MYLHDDKPDVFDRQTSFAWVVVSATAVVVSATAVVFYQFPVAYSCLGFHRLRFEFEIPLSYLNLGNHGLG